MNNHNEMQTTFLSVAENESFARVVIAAFAVQLSPTVSEIADIKTAVSEAVTNAIVHGYEGTRGMVTLRATIQDRDPGQRQGHTGCIEGHGTLLHHPPGAGTQRHGLCCDANLYG